MSVILDIVTKVKSGETSARQQVVAALERATAAAEYNALLNLTADRALARAAEIDSAVQNGQQVGVLAGVPFVVKDNYLAFGAPSTAASKILENFDTPLQATVVE